MATDQTFRADPRWIAAQKDLTDDPRPGETPQDTLRRGIAAAHRMYAIEVTASA